MVRTDAAGADLSGALKALRQSLDMGAVAVVGAGVSIAARFPATAGLDALLHESLESPFPTRAGTPLDSLRAWEALSHNERARARFQSQFAAIDRDRSTQPSQAHEALARLIHANIIETVVSLNWDTALERAYERLYGTSIPSGVLFKPHGDAADPGSEWILPHEDGVVTAPVRTRIDQLVFDHARTLVVVGYSESDETISRELISPLDARWRTIRIGPSVTGDYDIPLTADEALGRITADLQIAEENSSWHSVTFGGSRGFEAALAGERLGPSDVDACPELSEVSRVVSALDHQRAVVLNGPSGSGKSITAYQSLRKMSRRGYEILRLRDGARGRSTGSWIGDLKTFPHRKILFIDDAQDLPADVVRELAESANPDRLVLIVGVDQVAGGVKTINVSGAAGVARLAHHIRDNADTLTPLVEALDDQVGRRPTQTPLEFRLAVAERENSPWQFFYVLTGGWRRARRLTLDLRERNRADVALTAVAVAQIAGVDSGVTRSELSSLLDILGRDQAWLDSALEILLSQRAIIESDSRLRCPHLQAAYHVVGWMLHPPFYSHTPQESVVVRPIASAKRGLQMAARPSGVEVQRPPELPEAEARGDQDLASAIVAHYLDMSSTPLRGCTWLIGRNLVGESQWVLRYRTKVLNEERWAQLARKAIDSPVDSTAEGAQLLTETLTWCPEVVLPIVREQHCSIEEWLRQLTPQNAWSLADLINALYNHDHRERNRFSAQLVSRVDPVRLATLVLDGGWSHIYSTSRGVNRILTAADDELREAVALELDRNAYREFLDAKRTDLDAMAELISALASIDHAFAIDLFDNAASTFARLYSADPIHNWSDIFDVLAFVLGFAPRFLRGRRRPPRAALAAARRFSDALETEAIAKSLAGPADEWGRTNFPELLVFLREVRPPVLRSTVKLVDLAEFERNLLAVENPSDDYIYVVTELWRWRPDEVNGILERLEPRLTRVSLYFPLMSPELTIRAMLRGVPFDLGLQHQRWSFAAAVISRLADVNRELTAELLESNLTAMVEGLSGNFSDPFEGLAAWVAAADDVDPTYIDRVITALPEGAVRDWSRAIRRPSKYGHARRREIAPLVFRALQLPGPPAREAGQLLRQFPSLAKLDPINDSRGL